MKAVLCPVCNGVGKVSAGFYNRGGDCQFWVSIGVSPEMCLSCNGKGWVEVHGTSDLVEHPDYGLRGKPLPLPKG